MQGRNRVVAVSVGYSALVADADGHSSRSSVAADRVRRCWLSAGNTDPNVSVRRATKAARAQVNAVVDMVRVLGDGDIIVVRFPHVFDPDGTVVPRDAANIRDRNSGGQERTEQREGLVG